MVAEKDELSAEGAQRLVEMALMGQNSEVGKQLEMIYERVHAAASKGQRILDISGLFGALNFEQSNAVREKLRALNYKISTGGNQMDNYERLSW